MRPAPRLAALLLALTALVGLAACSGDSSFTLPPVPSTAATEPSTTLPDYSNVSLAAVAGATTTTAVPDIPGRSSLGGTVTGPDGMPVAGATVRAERLVADQLIRFDQLTQADGTWKLPNVLGGRWRVRAWRAPDLTLTQPAVLFLGGADDRTIDFALAKEGGTGLQVAIAPSPPVVGVASEIAVSVAGKIVDSDGVVRSVPRTFVSVQLVTSGDWSFQSPNPQFTNSAGEVRWQAVCNSIGGQGLSALVDSQYYQLQIPDCVLATTTTQPVVTTNVPPTSLSATTTTRPFVTTTTRKRTTTTSTTIG